MTGFIEDQLLRFEGLTDADVAAINAALPELEHLLQIVKTEWPAIAKAIPVLLPIVQKIVAKQMALQT